MQAAFTAGNDAFFWQYLSLEPLDKAAADVQSAKLTLGSLVTFGADPAKLVPLQVNLFHGWMDKFRLASPESTDLAFANDSTCCQTLEPRPHQDSVWPF